MARRPRASAGVATLLCCGAVHAADVPATPADYQSKLSALQPGDTLKLAAGSYANGITLSGINGQAGSPITIEGAAGGGTVFLGKSGKNTIDIKNSSYVVIRNLVLDGQDIAGIDAIKAGGQATDFAHHITIEGCTITGHDGGGSSQQTVGISTKIVAWDWVVRGNVIDGAGTGMYFGNSDGTRAFIGGTVEGNLFKNTLGYNMQIKHQLHRQQADVPSVPTEKRITVVRHNVFIKSNNPSPDGARPNLLIDGFPDSGPGSQDHAEIYGNFFFHNDDDALFQGSGRLHLHDNLFVDSLHPAIRLTNHQGKTVIDGVVYNNTIHDTATGIAFSSVPSGLGFVVGNAIFSPQPLTGTMATKLDNVTDSVANAGNYVVAPGKVLGSIDLYPKAGSALKAGAIDLTSVQSDLDYDRDFNGTTKDFSYRGAYQGEGTNPGWKPDATPKTGGGSAGTGGTGTGGGGGSAGAATGGAGGAGAGGAATGGAATGGASSGGGAGASGGAATSGGDDGGCGCRVPSRDSGGGWAALLALAGVLFRRRWR